ncbi:MAG: hypothetical protein V1765_03180 [bacterium]
MSNGVLCKHCGCPETAHDVIGSKKNHKYVPDKKDVRVRLKCLVEDFRPNDKDNRNKYNYYTKIVGKKIPIVEKKLADHFEQFKGILK